MMLEVDTLPQCWFKLFHQNILIISWYCKNGRSDIWHYFSTQALSNNIKNHFMNFEVSSMLSEFGSEIYEANILSTGTDYNLNALATPADDDDDFEEDEDDVLLDDDIEEDAEAVPEEFVTPDDGELLEDDLGLDDDDYEEDEDML